jgi:hypothetical protein
VDLTRRLTFFADPFPKDYARTCVDPGVLAEPRPAHRRLPGRQPDPQPRLDMLPLFAHLDAERVRARVEDERIKARPTLHYRLPNSEIDRPDWGLGAIWDDWLVLERLATDPKRLDRAVRRYSAFLDSPWSPG